MIIKQDEHGTLRELDWDGAVTARKMPKQKPGKSWQDVGTPDWLIKLVEATWGRITYDAAASEANHVCKQYADGSPGHDGLLLNWGHESTSFQTTYDDDDDRHVLPVPGLVWVNPPYSKISPWVEKASASECAVVMLVPAAVGSNWWAEHVDGKAAVYFIRPRLVFKGHTQPYPKDCALLVYGIEKPGYKCVRVTPDTATLYQEPADAN